MEADKHHWLCPRQKVSTDMCLCIMIKKAEDNGYQRGYSEGYSDARSILTDDYK